MLFAGQLFEEKDLYRYVAGSKTQMYNSIVNRLLNRTAFYM